MSDSKVVLPSPPNRQNFLQRRYQEAFNNLSETEKSSCLESMNICNSHLETYDMILHSPLNQTVIDVLAQYYRSAGFFVSCTDCDKILIHLFDL